MKEKIEDKERVRGKTTEGEKERERDNELVCGEIADAVRR